MKVLMLNRPMNSPYPTPIALIPGQAKRLVRHLNHEQVEVGVRSQSPNCDFHDFDGTDGFNANLAVRIGRNRGKRGQTCRADEIEREAILGMGRRGKQRGCRNRS